MPEYFETFDERGHLTGRAPRAVVHREGLWHRSTDVWLFRPDGRLLLQRRAGQKDLYPGRWDYSVGEHLLPGESYQRGAERGLVEELGLGDLALVALGGLRRSATEAPEFGILDREFCRSWRALYTGGPLRPDTDEVVEVAWHSPAEVVEWLRREPEAFTPWFVAAGRETGMLPLR